MFLDAIRRRWLLVAGVTAFCILGALAYGQVRHSSYEADTTVIVYPVNGAPFSQQQTGNLLVDLSTEAQVVKSDKVAPLALKRLAAEGYDKLTVAGLIARVSATVETNTQVLRITYTAGAPRRARDGADAFAAGYLDYREAVAKSAVSDDLAQIAAQRKSLQAVLSSDQQQLSGTSPTSAEGGRLRAEILIADKSLADLRAQEADITKRSTLAGEVLSPATLPAAPHGISAPILGGFGLLAGLILGVLVAVARERMVGTIRRAESLPDEPPTLAVVPAARRAEPVVLSSPQTRAAEAYRLLYLAADSALPVSSSRGNIIAISSLTEPAPPTGINLALAAANAGRATTYVDALPRNSAPRLRLLNTDPSARGFADAILEGLDPVATRLSVAPGLTLLPAGADIDRAAQSYGGPRTHRVLEALRRAADLVVIAIPPLTEPDGQALAHVADAVVIAVAVGSATFSQLDSAVVEAGRVHANVLGLVAVHPASGASSARSEPDANAFVFVPGEQRPPEPATWVPS